MSYTFRDQEVRAKTRVPHRCALCRETIENGEIYRRWVGTFEGDFQSHAYHRICNAYWLNHGMAEEYNYEHPDPHDFLEEIRKHYTQKAERILNA